MLKSWDFDAEFGRKIVFKAVKMKKNDNFLQDKL